nr:slit homolog 1 protein-like isoform X1 [Crassostrea gigas]
MHLKSDGILKNMKTLVFAAVVLWISSLAMQQSDGPLQCVIIQDKQGLTVPFNPPSFLTSNIKTQCQVYGSGHGMLRCGTSDVYVRAECVCSFYNVYEAKYHNFSSCPQGEKSDDVTKLKCPDCLKYSMNRNGPCINGGNLICNGNEVAPNIKCRCPLNYKGMFCEEKIENVTRICDRISSTNGLTRCDSTRMECVTFSRNRRYAYKCQETDASQERRGLPLCVDTEDTTQLPVRAPIYPTTMNPTEPDHSLTSSADIIVSTYVLTYISLSL